MVNGVREEVEGDAIMATFKIKQGGMVVASGCGPTEAAIMPDALHYALVYSEDGPVEVFISGKLVVKVFRPMAAADTKGMP